MMETFQLAHTITFPLMRLSTDYQSHMRLIGVEVDMYLETVDVDTLPASVEVRRDDDDDESHLLPHGCMTVRQCGSPRVT